MEHQEIEWHLETAHDLRIRGFEADGVDPQEVGYYQVFRRGGTYGQEVTDGDHMNVEPMVWFFLRAMSIGVGIYNRPRP